MRGRVVRSGAWSSVLLVSVLVAAPVAGPQMRPRCSLDPRVAAQYIIPPSPFKARLVSVRGRQLPPGEPLGGGRQYERLYIVTFFAVRGNAVLPTGHRYEQFSYVRRNTLRARWCFLKGGSGP